MKLRDLKTIYSAMYGMGFSAGQRAGALCLVDDADGLVSARLWHQPAAQDEEERRKWEKNEKQEKQEHRTQEKTAKTVSI